MSENIDSLDTAFISLDDAVGFVATEHYLDYNHLNLKNLHVGVDNFVYQQDHIACKVSSLTVEEENSQLYVDHLQTRFLMDSTLIKAEEIDLKMPESAVSGDFVIDLTLLDSLGTGFMTSALKGYLASQDLISIATPYLPDLKTYWPEKSTSFKANGYLTRDTFQLDEFALRVPDHVDIMVEGFGVSPFSKEHRKVNATARCKLQDADFLLSSFVAKPEDRSYFLPKDLIAEVDGSYRKTYAQAEMLIKQEDNIILEGLAKYNIDSESYDVNVKTDRLKLTEFVPSSGIEGLTTHVNAKGRHFDFPGKYTLADACMMSPQMPNSSEADILQRLLQAIHISCLIHSLKAILIGRKFRCKDILTFRNSTCSTCHRSFRLMRDRLGWRAM